MMSLMTYTSRSSSTKPFSNYVEYLNSTITIPSTFKYKAIDLFAGCGGLSLGFEVAGIEVFGYEADFDCCATHNKNMGDKCKCEFLTEETEFPEVDIVIGGPPCQPFSVSGKQLGKKDNRNGFPIFISAVRRLKPKLFMFENVRGVFYRNKEYFDSVISELEALGYNVTYKILNAVNYDVPQNRERVICVGSLKTYHFPSEKEYVVSAGEAIGDISDTPSECPRYLTESMDRYIASYEEKSHCKTPRDLHLHKPARTLTCRNLAGATSDMQRVKLEDGRRRRLTTREAARLQSFPDWFSFSGSVDSIFKQIGNAVPPFLAYSIAKSFVEYLDSDGMNADDLFGGVYV